MKAGRDHRCKMRWDTDNEQLSMGETHEWIVYTLKWERFGDFDFAGMRMYN